MDKEPIDAHQKLAERGAELDAKFVELGPDIQQALNHHLGRLCNDPKSAPLGSFDEARLLQGDKFSVHVVNVNSRSLYHDRYIAGNVCDQLFVNPGKRVLRVRIFQQHFENEDFNHPNPLELDELDLAPGERFFAAEDCTAVLPTGGPGGSIFLALRSRPKTPYNWMYDASNLEPQYLVCVDPNITQILFLLNTLSKSHMVLPDDLEQRLSVHPDFSVRWAIADYLLLNEPNRALERLHELADHDSTLSERAKSRISFLQARRRG